jgi:hypothetical protein
VYLSQSGGDGSMHRSQSELVKYTVPLASDSESKEIAVFPSSEASTCEAKHRWPLDIVICEKGISLENGICLVICAYDRGKKLAFLLLFPPYGISSVQLRGAGRNTAILSWINANLNYINPLTSNLSLLIAREIFSRS